MSRIFKPSRYAVSDEKVVLNVTVPSTLQTVKAEEKLQKNNEPEFPAVIEAEEEAKTIISDAEELAQKILSDATRQVEQLQQQTKQEMDRWWEEKQQELARLTEEQFEQARQSGYLEGVEQGKQAALQEQEQNVQMAREVLIQAQATKLQIIAEAEPFLVGLSSEIAKKIIEDELNLAPEKILQMVTRVISRSQVQGQITLSVHPQYYTYVEEHRTQFLTILDGRAELTIIPDFSVHDQGCVIRTPLGNVDARIDTQLSEIKQALLEIARGSEVDDHA